MATMLVFTSVGLSALPSPKFEAVCGEGYPLYPSLDDLRRVVGVTDDDIDAMKRAGTAAFPSCFEVDRDD